MKYLVLLRPDSWIGMIYATGKENDGFAKSGNDEHPCPLLVCTHLEIDNPHYIFVERPRKGGASHQHIYLPHGSVVAIHRFDDDQPPPFGFVPSS